jgi:hypothetical protein
MAGSPVFYKLFTELLYLWNDCCEIVKAASTTIRQYAHLFYSRTLKN